MSTGRDLAYEHIRIVVPLMMVLWRLPSAPSAAELQEAIDARAQLNDRLSFALSDIESYYDEELVALLRSTSSVKGDLPVWHSLLENTKLLFESRHGVEQTKALLVGMI